MDESRISLLNTDRRRLLAGLAGAASFGALANSCSRSPDESSDLPTELLRGIEVQVDDRFWDSLKQGYALKPGLIHLNSANLAAGSNAVLETADKLSRNVNGDPSFENRSRFEDSERETRNLLALMLGTNAHEIAITRNTSESNRTVIAGLDFTPDDEVVIWDQNHESNSLAWDVWAQRYGFKVVRVSTPPEPTSPSDLIEPFRSAMNARTKLISFSHVSNLTGVALPARDICRMASRAGVMTLVDGAQSFGMMALDLKTMGCDFYTASAHKWLAGPYETGVLYVHDRRIDQLWPSMVTHNWEALSVAGARKFECLGQRQDGRIAALATAVKLHRAIGRFRVEDRIRYLGDRIRDGLKTSGKKFQFVTPENSVMNGGIVCFLIPQENASAVMRTLYTDYNVSALAIPYGGQTLVRFSPNVYNLTDEIDIAVEGALSAV